MNRMTVYDQTRLCFKVTPHQESGRSVIQELGIYEDIHEEEIKKARNITDIRDLYFTKGAKLDPYWENLGKPKKERSGWIPVSERLPEDGQEILFSTKTGRVHSGRYHDDDSANQWYSHKDKCRAWNNVVTAWMLLPECYKAESEG